MPEENGAYDNTTESVLAVVGGGRWGRVIVSVLAEMKLPFSRVVVVSRGGSQAMARLLDAQKTITRLPFSMVASIEELLLLNNVKGAVVVNSAHQHFNTSARLIDHGINVLIEKPIVLSIDHAQILLNKATASGVCLVPGLQYRFCSYLHYFAEKLLKFGKKPYNFFIEWSDQVGESRYNEVKTYDSAINVAQDVMPHIWTILSTIFPGTHMNIDSCQSDQEGRCADFSISMEGQGRGRVTLERDACRRRRIICVQFGKNESLSIDFTQEPGTILLNGKTILEDPNWGKKQRPLARQLCYFFSVIDKGVSADWESRACLDSVSFSENASVLLRMHQKQLLSCNG